MPSAVKKRKVSGTVSKNAGATKTRGLNSFTTISKASVPVPKSIDEKSKQTENSIIAQSDSNSTNSKKRKLQTEEEEKGEELSAAVRLQGHKEERQLRQQPSPSSRLPQTPRKPITTSSSAVLDTPTKGASTLLDRLLLTPRRPSKSPLHVESSSSRIATPTSKQTQEQPSKEGTQLPAELLDLINLHAAFLTTLTLHCAHNGSNAPADLRVICPDVARTWGRRKVFPNDIRRTIGILNSSVSESPNNTRLARISLLDYGHGKLCVEIEAGSRKGNNLRVIDEDLLNGAFSQGVVRRWETKDDGITTQEFVEALPIAETTPCSSLLKMSAVLAKGQRRLEDMKAGIAIKKDIKKEQSVPKGSSAAVERKPTLLERIRAKQLRQSLLPQAPSKADLERRAALHRMEEVVSVLSILSTSGSAGQQRVSFTVPTLLGKLRDSFKNPVSKEEGYICVKLLASDIAPEWVQVVKMGKSEALVFDREKKPGELDIKERIKTMGRIE
ncbi:hypothetical protein CJF32_00000370 [Rutstroemia sp. NJR-2017a WRK4]|nr:hypothetical protein CJF32_00000350 [Rutstroemia sp. NJR-2017a WRK4]PQE27395.1 hypothetical protein CJF32_00000370 [Rutstroemia sp. NJR-2017a WRK4]